MSIDEHKRETPEEIRFKVITVSDTRDKETDKSGRLMIQLLEQSGHAMADYVIVKDEQEAIRAEIISGCNREDIDVVLTNGGTGIAKRDVTIETIQQLLEKEIVGFGELFRFLSYQEDIGSAAILSRAIAGVLNNTAIFATPGSTGAVKLAMTRLILPELGHVVKELRKDL
ncbi:MULTISPECIES: molybdenum cofactor biosynthesis protein B [unclassified Bacillus (in: firmicutes)]|uniref:MogA/MoaB family molybdenum cofactor biosynthesis protein n=1 Tax=unclassified Bacillus (in: firmicutes) TaxID=185979 RepID=UPI0008F0B404|nr:MULTISPECIES: molybdenum cofactor biosynthesis protein B [unclassified Bacillus (in: firmicutes)]SFB17502.1 molybdopterin adenylyltransferase [Bacillus sp. UNCCL13]SFQ76967.1 molybdopterin adenylyltransferase [Bacillus sp. cl95]